jgi:hypothetical protein
MTRDEAREFAKVVQAYADGKSVEYTNKNTEGWVSLCTADRHYWFDTEMFDYRIKPEPREWWVMLDCDMDDDGLKYQTEADATAAAEEWNRTGSFAPYTVFHVREVTP